MASVLQSFRSMICCGSTTVFVFFCCFGGGCCRTGEEMQLHQFDLNLRTSVGGHRRRRSR